MLFLTFTSVDARYGSKELVSVPLSGVREIREVQMGVNVGNDYLRDAKAVITMSGKDVFYWTLETRSSLVDQAKGLS